MAVWNPSVKGFYACSSRTKDERERDGIKGHIYLHRFLTGAKKGQHVDHENHNTLDCRRSNLRACSPSVNGQNRKNVDPRSRTGYRGVSVHKNADGRLYYVAKISVCNYFPYDDDGFERAKQRADELRERLKGIDDDEQ